MRALVAKHLGLAILLCAAAGAQAGPSAGQVSAEVTRTTLTRAVGGKPSSSLAGVGTAIQWNDLLQTDRHGRVRILLNDQSILTLGSDSRLQVVKHDAASQQTSLDLVFGRIRAQVAPITRSGGSFRMRTPTSVVGVVGTDFGADATVPGQTTFVCMAGITRIFTLDLRHYLDCGPGMTVTVVLGEALPLPTPAEPDQLERWRHITEPGDPRFADTLGPGAPAPSVSWHGLAISGDWRFRVEASNWFTDGAANHTYAYPQSILHLGIGQQRPRFDWMIELAQPTLLALPDHAIASGLQGQLGLGATYFAANGGRRNTAAVFPSRAFLRFKGLGGRETNQLTLGRFRFLEGAETTPSDKTLAWLQLARIAQRLIGDFSFAVTGRSDDGILLSLNPGRANLTFAAGRPTRGVFQVEGLGELDVAWEYGALTLPTGGELHPGVLRVFGLGYQDVRAVVKTDNRPLAARSGPDRFVDINLGTLGFDYLQALHTVHAGTFDLMVWAAGQAGQWGLQSHRAGALALEAGWQPPQLPLKPWLRLGYFTGSGDGNPNDARHATFFQVLPTPRIYARFPFYNLENTTDVFAMLLLRPSSRFSLRSDGHALWLTSRHDLWYQGGGAFQPDTFGYTGRSGGGARGLGNLWDLSADYRLSSHWALGLYYAHVWGKGVERNIYPAGQDADFGYVETLFKF